MNHKRMLALSLGVLLAVTSSFASAKGFKYSFAEFGYRNIDADSLEADGFRASFSFGATDYVQVIGDYSRLFVDDMDGASEVDVDVDEYKIGIGGHYSVSDKIDIVGQIAYVDDEITGKALIDGDDLKSNINESEDGYEATFFGRVQATKKLELTPHVVHRDVGDSDTGFGLGMVYKLKKKFAVRLRGTHFSDDSATNLFIGLRLYM
jgi:hypothetical protein